MFGTVDEGKGGLVGVLGLVLRYVHLILTVRSCFGGRERVRYCSAGVNCRLKARQSGVPSTKVTRISSFFDRNVAADLHARCPSGNNFAIRSVVEHFDMSRQVVLYKHGKPSTSEVDGR